MWSSVEDLQAEFSDEVMFTHFLYVGKHHLDYQPGNWEAHRYFNGAYSNNGLNEECVLQLARNPEKQLVPTQIILKAFESHLVPHRETLVYALAVCCRQTESESLRHAAYSLVSKICADPRDFILFVKFFSRRWIGAECENWLGSKGRGWGSGLRKAVNSWYLSKDALELAKCVTRYKGRYGWKHKDIIKLSHPSANEPEKEVVLKYIMFGIGSVKDAYGADNRFTDIIKYLEQVEQFKHCQDEVEAAGLVEICKLTLDHVPGHLLKSKEVWDALIPSMNLVTLLNNLQRIHNLEFLKPNSVTVSKIVDEITDERKLARDKVHPALVLITIRNYENSGKPLSFEKRKMKEQAKVPLPAPPKPNSKIIDALYKTLNLSFNHLQPTDKRYMVTINMNKEMLEMRSWHNGNVSVAEAGCMIALSLLRCERNITVATFKDVGIHTVNIDKTASFGQAMRRLQQMPVGNVDLCKPMAWAAYQKNKYDVFINIDGVLPQSNCDFIKPLKTYQTEMQLPNTKLINCFVSMVSSNYKANPNGQILHLNGFDHTVPVVIQAFAKSLF